MLMLKPLRRRRVLCKRLPKKTVTVCVAAIADRTTLIGVSDRMLTAGDVEFEPDQAKIWNFTSSIFALIAGDAAIQAELMKLVHKETKGEELVYPHFMLPRETS